ncbi:cation:proton antiporter [Halobellus salinus]|uniref:Cation:proton antiporter n=1 Tax=Halobellus salinus TaxID=931585 RepID=A0A830EHQ4_9EURY|nr:monovalent cation/H+ antiporter subunit E [Halobellus salinus]GGJ11377.1 cation:proton antiporter [Halobellus salinus]SMP03656.1 multisubunit sodium/proton antiporter, MrpE subunit [Halobellus salinus]
MAAGSARILVPVGASSTFRNTVAYAVRAARSGVEAGAEAATVHFVSPARGRTDSGNLGDDIAADLLDRAVVWAREDLDRDADDDPAVEIRTAIVGADRYLFSPGDYADAVAEYAAEFGLDRVVVDPGFQPGGNAPMLLPFERELARSSLTVEEAPTTRRTERVPLVSRATLSKGVATFGATYAFYLLIAGSVTPFNLATGALTALLAAAGFSSVSFLTSPSPRRTGARVLRLLLFVPYLVWEITKANLSIAYIILHPSLPIDPEMQRYRAAVWGGFPVTTLGNSITLTPGTLTVDVGREGLDIHTLTGGARDDLAAGGLERAVRFVFYGRSAARIPSPAERGSISAVDDTDTDTDTGSGGSVVIDAVAASRPSDSRASADDSDPRPAAPDAERTGDPGADRPTEPAAESGEEVE